MATELSKNYRVVIISRARWQTIKTHKLMPYATLVVPNDEVDYYKITVKENLIIPIPKEISGLGSVRNWVLDNFSEEVVIMADDDIARVCVNSQLKNINIIEVEAIRLIIEQCLVCAKEAGCGVFGFSQTWDVRKYKANEPITFSGWVGGLIGIIGRDIKFDEENKLKVDVDYCLRNLLIKRIVWVDNRFSFYQVRNNNVGGNSLFRTAELLKAEVARLKIRWGKYFQTKHTRTGETTSVVVPRRQTLII